MAVYVVPVPLCAVCPGWHVTCDSSCCCARWQCCWSSVGKGRTAGPVWALVRLSVVHVCHVSCFCHFAASHCLVCHPLVWSSVQSCVAGAQDLGSCCVSAVSSVCVRVWAAWLCSCCLWMSFHGWSRPDPVVLLLVAFQLLAVLSCNVAGCRLQVDLSWLVGVVVRQE